MFAVFHDITVSSPQGWKGNHSIIAGSVKKTLLQETALSDACHLIFLMHAQSVWVSVLEFHLQCTKATAINTVEQIQQTTRGKLKEVQDENNACWENLPTAGLLKSLKSISTSSTHWRLTSVTQYYEVKLHYLCNKASHKLHPWRS